MTLPTKPEIHNVSQRRQRRTDPTPQTTCAKMAKIGCVVFELCERTDENRQTDRQTDICTVLIAIFHTPPGSEVVTNFLQISVVADEPRRDVQRHVQHPTRYKQMQTLSLVNSRPSKWTDQLQWSWRKKLKNLPHCVALSFAKTKL